MGGEDEGGKLVGGFELSAVLNIAQALVMSESSLEYFGKYQMHPQLVSVCFKCIPVGVHPCTTRLYCPTLVVRLINQWFKILEKSSMKEYSLLWNNFLYSRPFKTLLDGWDYMSYNPIVYPGTTGSSIPSLLWT